MTELNSWKDEDDSINWKPYEYRALNYRNKRKSRKESDAQRSFRMKFGLANSILTQIRKVLKLSFVKYDKGRKSGYNVAVGLFMSNAVRGDYPNLEVNYSAIEVSKGTLPGLHQWEFSVEEDTVSLTWKNEDNKRHASTDDHVHFLLYGVRLKQFIAWEDSAHREDQSLNYTILKTIESEYVAWVFVINRDKNNSSNSHYLGSFVS